MNLVTIINNHGFIKSSFISIAHYPDDNYLAVCATVLGLCLYLLSLLLLSLSLLLVFSFYQVLKI